MLTPFDFILITCAVTGAVMVFSSIILLYQGVIKLSGKSVDSAVEAEFKNQLRINVRNPALGLFVIGFSFFVLALYFANPRAKNTLVVSGHIRIADADQILVKLKSEEWPIVVSSEGEIFTTIQPLEKLAVAIEAPGHIPPKWFHQIVPDEERDGRVEIHTPEFVLAPPGIALTKPKFDAGLQPVPTLEQPLQPNLTLVR